VLLHLSDVLLGLNEIDVRRSECGSGSNRDESRGHEAAGERPVEE
jgi:hypothetical protein